MAASFLIIDGYNLLHAAGLGRASYGPGDLGRKRHELLVRIAAGLPATERARCTVVFDSGEAPPDQPRRFKHGEITVIFAEPGQEADDLIETLIKQHSAPRQLTVVSSDHRLQTAVQRRRGAAVDSDQFLTRLASAAGANQTANSVSSAPHGAPSDLDFWLNEFRDVSPAAISDKLQSESVQPQSSWDARMDELQRRLLTKEGLDDWIDQPDKRKPPPTSP